jgi:hypothetical protein
MVANNQVEMNTNEVNNILYLVICNRKIKLIMELIIPAINRLVSLYSDNC